MRFSQQTARNAQNRQVPIRGQGYGTNKRVSYEV